MAEQHRHLINLLRIVEPKAQTPSRWIEALRNTTDNDWLVSVRVRQIQLDTRALGNRSRSRNQSNLTPQIGQDAVQQTVQGWKFKLQLANKPHHESLSATRCRQVLYPKK
ncbi:MAG: hypothetical protein VX405_06060 [Myxococcota bacterium]|nr:hypothetical protein [Myxococcota bacterium]